MRLVGCPYILLWLFVLFCGVGCDTISGTFTGDKVLAEVGDYKLTVSDLESVFTPGITPQDSVKLLESYVDMWVRKQLKVQQAELMFSQNAPDIDRMVEEYRSLLLSRKLDNYFIEHRLDTTFTAEQIEDYYGERKGEFILDRTIVKGRVVVMPQGYRQHGRVKELIKWSSQSERNIFMDICNKNGFTFTDFAVWTDYSDFLAALPAGRERSEESVLTDGGVQDIKSDQQVCYFLITEYRRQGEPLPLERAKPMIKSILTNSRTIEIVRQYEDSLYQVAVKDKKIVINLEK